MALFRGKIYEVNSIVNLALSFHGKLLAIKQKIGHLSIYDTNDFVVFDDTECSFKMERFYGRIVMKFLLVSDSLDDLFFIYCQEGANSAVVVSVIDPPTDHISTASPPNSVLGTISSMALSPDNQTLAVGYSQGDICFWTIRKEDISFLKKISTGTTLIRSLSFSRNNQNLAFGNSGYTSILKDWNDFPLGCTSIPHSPKEIIFSNDDQQLAVIRDDKYLYRWNLGGNNLTNNLLEIPIYGYAFLPNGREVMIGKVSDGLWLMDSYQNKIQCLCSDDQFKMVSMSYSTGKIAIYNGLDSVSIWDVLIGNVLTKSAAKKGKGKRKR